MTTSFEERLARLNERSGSSAALSDQPTCAPTPQPHHRKTVGSPLKLLLVSFVGGLVVIGGLSIALPRVLADDPVQVIATARE
ncbi:hypothetical protein [Antarctobacter heliothermus]|uniref:Uncharacterized protein n=1 Tax=Antarctobacter heliothermus TaxID=74033 RepID=A0A239H941_9RHOB|nr:hypothetical protein [Antarctobacter heliothermus]SNS77333.1 hypothetical protein SAMN04488078_103146 [Antarctobacter heliothermus]